MKAATGEDVTAEELGGADVHTRLSGVADYLAEDDAHALQIARTIVSTLNTRKTLPADVIETEEPGYDPHEFYGVVSSDLRKPYDVREVIARLVDGSRFDEFKERYAPTIVTGFARLHGFLIGIIANNGVLFSESALKATHFIEMCNLRGIPLVFLQNITGFMVGQAVRARRHRERWRQDGPRRGQLRRAEVHDHHRRLVRCGQLRDVRPRVRAALPLDVAERAHFGHGRRAGRGRPGHGEARAARAREHDADGRRGTADSPADSRQIRAGRLAAITPPRGSGTTGFSTRQETRSDARPRRSSASFNAPIPPTEIRRLPDVTVVHLLCSPFSIRAHVLCSVRELEAEPRGD